MDKLNEVEKLREKEVGMAKEIEDKYKALSEILFLIPFAIDEFLRFEEKIEQHTLPPEEFVRMTPVPALEIVEQERTHILSTMNLVKEKRNEIIAFEQSGEKAEEVSLFIEQRYMAIRETLADLNLHYDYIDLCNRRVIWEKAFGEKDIHPAEKERLEKLQKEIKKYGGEVLEAKEKMANANREMVVPIAKRHMNEGVELSELIRAGNEGLMKATAKFDYRKGYKFSTYASWWVNFGVKEAVKNQKRPE